MTILKLDGVTKLYFRSDSWSIGRKQDAAVRAVDEVSFSIDEAETVALVGESGCGKTTLGNLVLGLLTPDAGTVSFEGYDISRLKRKMWTNYRRGVQAVFQDPWSSLDPRWKVREHIAEPMAVTKTFSRIEIKAIVPALLEEVGLNPSHADKYPHEFSGGQRQRIAIACAIATRPKLIVLDEPISALDVSARAGILRLIRKLQKDHGISYLFITHDLAAARVVANRVVVMYMGQVVEIGPIDKVFQHPLHPYTAALLDASRALEVGAIPLSKRPKVSLPTGDTSTVLNSQFGCRFRSRCASATEICAQETPKLVAVGTDRHVSACAGCVAPNLPR